MVSIKQNISSFTTLLGNTALSQNQRNNYHVCSLEFKEEEENNLPQMKPLFFLYVWLNLTRIAGLRKENLVKHIRKRTIQTGRLFFSSSLK